MDDFQAHYSCVITGTGLTQSIVAAAMARVGKSVFHCDQNHFYSQEWQSMNFTQIVNWCHSSSAPAPTDTSSLPDLHLLQDVEVFRNCFRGNYVTNVCQISYLCDEESVDMTAAAAVVAVTPTEVNEPIIDGLIVDEVVPPPDVSNDVVMATATVDEDRPKSWSLYQFNLESRQFNLDLTPRYENQPISEFLSAQNLSSILQKFILNAIAMTSEDCPTKEALKLIHNFIHSAGRFGNTPFLFTLYGTGELPQAFCRLCAVFGGTYCLKKKCQSLIVDQNNKCNAVVIDGRRFNCDFVVTDYSLTGCDDKSGGEANAKYISRAILISDQSIKKADSEHLSLLHIPASDQNKSSVFVIEVGSSCLVAPKGLFVQYLWCDSFGDNAKHDLMPIVKKLYNFTQESDCEKPKALWSVYFNQMCSKPDVQNLPQNVYITTPPVNELDFDFAINECSYKGLLLKDGARGLGLLIIFDGQPNDVEINEPNNQVIAPVVNNDHNSNNI
ncbi:unnamed protein product [Medioppia subpectinata]|uniref:RAE1/2 domain-containing protein n=1 Tax=Medioppia subpectinata TaxID=1979941 RepID=A0A7R9KPY5_9ACAR|nr:unnamed protein product [Medioppia subpectinata]CAG2107651.1 unnamed protein product [Medioppia subpectinata]